jgi:serine/threonine protein kinase
VPFTNSVIGPGFEPGSQVATYEIAEEIGRGGMAVVYRARDLRLGRWVALKILSGDVTRDRAFQQRFIRESRAAAAVDHPNILPIFDAGEADGVFYIAMRYVADRDLGNLIDRIGPLPTAHAVSITAQIGSALDAAHARGLVHRDVKPPNILLGDVTENDAGNHVYLSDFGISMAAGVPGADAQDTGGHDTGVWVPLSRRRPAGESRLTATNEALGTVNYAAPEQILGLEVDGRADIYSLACVFFEMLAGRPPFTGECDEFGRLAQFSPSPPRLTAVRPDLPPAVDQVIAKALSVVPEDRYSNCRALAVALAEACGPGTSQPPDESAEPAAAPAAARVAPSAASLRRRRAVAGVCVAVLAVGGATWMLLHGTSSPRSVRGAGNSVIVITPTTINAPSRRAAASPRATASPAVSAAASSSRPSSSRPSSATALSAAAPSTAPSPAASPSTAPSPAAPSPAAPAGASAADCTKTASAMISADCYTQSNGTIDIISTDDPSPAGVDANQAAQLADGDYLEYPDINFGAGSNHFSARVACGAPLADSGGVEVVLDNPANKSVAGFSIANTGGWNSWKDIGTTMSEVTGVHNVYIVLTSGGPAPYVSLHYLTFAEP